MKPIKGTIPEELDEDFRREVAKRLDLRCSALSEALEGAIRQWINSDYQKVNQEVESEYSALKLHLSAEYSGKFCILSENHVVAVADSIIEATQLARTKHPEIKKFQLIHAVSPKIRQTQLDWRVRSILR